METITILWWLETITIVTIVWCQYHITTIFQTINMMPILGRSSFTWGLEISQKPGAQASKSMVFIGFDPSHGFQKVVLYQFGLAPLETPSCCIRIFSPMNQPCKGLRHNEPIQTYTYIYIYVYYIYILYIYTYNIDMHVFDCICKYIYIYKGYSNHQI